MKTLYQVLFLTLFISIPLLSQSQQLVKPGNQWNIYYPPTFSPSFTTEIVGILSDTIFDDISYYKLGKKENPSDPSFVFQNAYMREDSTKKVYIKYSTAEETLLYDFGMEIGDTITYSGYCQMYVVAIDSVLLNNNTMRKRFELEGVDTPYESQFWVEGIGSNLSMDQHMGNFCLFDAPARLLCFYEDDQLLYPDDPPSCFLTDVNDVIVDANIDIYPNPFSDQIIINDIENSFVKATIYNPLGEIIHHQPLNDTITKISLSDLRVGIYYLSLVDEDGKIFTESVLKQ